MGLRDQLASEGRRWLNGAPPKRPVAEAAVYAVTDDGVTVCCNEVVDIQFKTDLTTLPATYSIQTLARWVKGSFPEQTRIESFLLVVTINKTGQVIRELNEVNPIVVGPIDTLDHTWTFVLW